MGARDARPPTQEGAAAADCYSSIQASEPLTGERYQLRARLPRGADLSRCWETGRRVRMPNLDVAWRPNPHGHARAGIVVPRFGKTAVARNRLQRRVREILRRELLRTMPAVDLVVRAKPTAYSLQFAVLRAELTEAAGRIPR